MTTSATDVPQSIGASHGVDRSAGVIRRASAMQAGTTRGKGVLIDDTTLRQVAALGNAKPQGIKVRFMHPTQARDGLGRTIGRMRNFSVVADKVVGDIHMNRAAGRAPEGNLRGYVLDLAEEDPEAFGMSVHIDPRAMWKLSDGTEVEVVTDADGRVTRPANAVGPMPFLRLSALHAVDIVDDPAANREGLFAWELPASLVATQPEPAADAESVASLSTDALRALSTRFPDHAELIITLYAGGKSEAEMLSALAEAQGRDEKRRTADALAASLAATAAAVASRDADIAARDARIADLSSSLDLVQTRYSALSALAAGAPRDPGASYQGPDRDPDAVLKVKWDAMSATEQAGYLSDFEVFKLAPTPS